MGSKMIQFHDIYMNLGKKTGKLRFADSGLGWKGESSEEPFTSPASDLRGAHWHKACRGYELKITRSRGASLRFDNFTEDDLETLVTALKEKYNIDLQQHEFALKGWNWGKTEFNGTELEFLVNNKNSFEVPLQFVSNANLTAKHEVAVEFALPGEADDDDKDARKEAKNIDQMVEMRFYIPGNVAKEEDSDDGERDGEETSAAQAFYETLKDKADVGEIAGDAIASFSDVALLTPRGRYDVDMYASSMRLRGKTYDYKVQYSSIVNMFLLPKSDDLNVLFIVGLDPPLRQGQTRYSFLVFQFLREEDLEIELNMDDEVYEEKYKDKLKKKYDQTGFEVVSQIFRGLTGRKVTVPSAYKSHHDQSCIKCNNKANEGSLYLLDKSALFVTKPTIFVPYADVHSVLFSRIGGNMTAGKTFDLTFRAKQGLDHQFTSINREEQANLESFFNSKNVKVKNDLNEDTAALLSAVLGAEADEEDDDVPNIRGDSGGEDEESPDEDFVDGEDDDSDVADEYDSDVQSSADEGSEEEAEAPPKKKSKK